MKIQSDVTVITGAFEYLETGEVMQNVHTALRRGFDLCTIPQRAAAGTQKRSAQVPELPTMVEAGVPGYEASTAFGVLAPYRTPKAIVDKLSRDVASLVQSPDVRESLGARGFEPVGSTAEQYREHLREELKRYATVVKVAGIRAD